MLSSATASASPSAVDLAIVIVNYNTVDLLRGCLRSLFESRCDLLLRVCVIDNASADGSPELVRAEFPQVELVVSATNRGYSAGNNMGLRRFGFGGSVADGLGASADVARLPRYVLLLNPDTLVPDGALDRMAAFMDERPRIGAAGPRVRRPDGSLDRACRRSFPTPQVSFYRMIGLGRLFPKSKRFNAYNLDYLSEDAVHEADSVVGAFMLVRREAILDAGLLDERFFMYGEDLDWAKRIKDSGWQVWYNGQVEITHVKEAASSQSSKSRIDFYEAMWIFYEKHYRARTTWWLDQLIRMGIVGRGALDVAGHLWRFCRRGSGSGRGAPEASGQTVERSAPAYASARPRSSQG